MMTPAKARTILKKMGVNILADLHEGRRVYGFFTEVPLDIIRMADYQRGVSEKHCSKIAEDFLLDCCLPLSISLRDMMEEFFLWCYDGQHRIATLLDLDYTTHYAQIVFGLTLEEEARRFYILNNTQRKMNGWVKFKAAFNSRNPAVIKLIAECKKRNLTQPVTCNLPRVKLGDIKSPEYLLWPLHKGGMSLVRAVLDVLDQCWRVDGDGPVMDDAKDTALVRGLATFLKTHYFGGAELPWSTIRMVLRNTRPSQIRELAKKEKTIRTDQRQYHQAICGMFGVDKQVKSPSCHLRRVA